MEHQTSLARRLINWLCVITVIGCTCNGGDDDISSSPLPKPFGLVLESATGHFRLQAVTPGMTFTMPVAVRTIDNEAGGSDAVVTPFGPVGTTFNPPTRTVTLPPGNRKAYVTFEVTVGASTPYGLGQFGARRTGPLSSAAYLVDSQDLNIVRDLVKVAITPANLEVMAGTSRDFTLAILPEGNTQGNVTLTLGDSPVNSGVTLSPASLVVNLSRGSTVPVMRTVRVTAAQSAEVQTHRFQVSVNTGFEVASVLYKVVNPNATPTFAITANPTSVSVPNLQVSTDSIEFTVTSVNGFNGNVTVNYSSPGRVIEPSPNVAGFSVAVIPGNPGKFTRRFQRNVSHQNPVPITFTARNADLTISKSVTVTINPATTGTPTFAISAYPMEVTVANGVSQDPATLVSFTVSSVNGFTGPIKITWITDGGVSPQPNNNDFVVNVTPSTPANFTRHFYRFTTGTEPIPITFNATDIPFTTAKDVTINVKHP